MTKFRLSARAACIAAIWSLFPMTSGIISAQEEPSAAQIIDALKPKAKMGTSTRSLTLGAPSSSDRNLINSLRNRQPRFISVEERTKAAEIAMARPNIDLEINFDYDSDV